MIAGISIAIFGAAYMHYTNDESGTPTLASGAGQSSPARTSQTEAKLSAPLPHYNDAIFPAALDPVQQPQNMTQARNEPQSTETTASAAPHDKLPVKNEDGEVQNLIAKTYDPTVTMSDIINSDEMHNLSFESKKRVMSEIVGKINRGELDQNTFVGGLGSQ